MVKAMPIQYLTLRLRPVVSKLIVPLASAALILSGSMPAKAAMQAEPSEDWASSIFSIYGLTFMLVVLLVGLFVYKQIRPKAYTIAGGKLFGINARAGPRAVANG